MIPFKHPKPEHREILIAAQTKQKKWAYSCHARHESDLYTGTLGRISDAGLRERPIESDGTLGRR